MDTVEIHDAFAIAELIVAEALGFAKKGEGSRLVEEERSNYDGEIVRGKRTGTVRASSYNMELPEYPEEASFFNQQSKTVS
jgi:acetyl-CoA acetyltransferase